jgi:hypothetical protein
MREWLFFVAICFSFTPGAANADCVEIAQSTAIMAATDRQEKAAIANLDAAPYGRPLRTRFIETLTSAINSATRSKSAVDRSVSLLQRAMDRKCLSPGPPFDKVLTDYRELSRILGADIRAYRTVRVAALRSRDGNPGPGGWALLCERAMVARPAKFGFPKSCR